MNIREELLKVAGLMKQEAAKSEIRSIIKTSSKADSISLDIPPVQDTTKIALEVANEMINKGLAPEHQYRNLVSNLIEMPMEKLASFRDGIGNGIFDLMDVDKENTRLVDASSLGNTSSPAFADWLDKYSG